MLKNKIQNSFNNLTKNKRLKKLNFLKKYIHKSSNIYLDMNSGMVRSDLKKTPQEILDYWSNLIFKNKNDYNYRASFPYAKARLQYVFENINNYFKYNKKLKITDFACGEGMLLKIFKKNGYKNILGVEGSALEVKKIKKNFNIDCCLTGLGFDKLKKFKKIKDTDVSILSWVLCNCINPLKVMREISDNTKYGSYICIAESSRILVPFKKNLNDYFSKKFIADAHPWNFTKQSLYNLLYLSDFEVCFTNKYKNSDVLFIIAKKVKKIKKQKLKVDSAEKIYNFFYYWHKISSKKNLFD
tara:strand:- start:200 stop:1096 length:897 start_codon:yes stop_codon:yes gene_type:complete